MKAFITSDLHLTFDKVLRQEDKTLSFLILNKITEQLMEIKPEYLFILGDVYHTKDTVSATVMNIYYDFVKNVTQNLKIKVIQIVGNHDYSIVDENQHYYHAFYQLADLDGLTIVDDTFILDNKFGFMSYTRGKEHFDSKMSKIKDCELLFAHLDINGFNPGDDYVEKRSYLNAEDLSSFKTVITGHYHEPQEKIVKKTRIIYVGSPYTVDFGESDQEKRFLLLDLDSLEIESLNTGMTFHKTYRINHDEDFPVISDKDIAKGIKHRIFIRGTKEQIDFAKIKIDKKYHKMILPDFVPVEKPRLELKKDMNKEDMIVKYAQYELEKKYGGVTESGLDLKKLEETGYKYISQVNKKR